MALRFTTLASGSGGNASLVQAGGYGVLIDCGLGPRQLAQRLASIGASWASVHAVLLTHTHGDHWRETTLGQLHERGISLWCHREHRGDFAGWSSAFGSLLDAGLIHDFAAGAAFAPVPGLFCLPFAVSHDSAATFGFRLEGTAELFGPPPTLAYAADLGCWDDATVAHLADVDALALEFNHDVELQLNSSRPQMLIDRVLGNRGHLSNVQAATLLRAVLARSTAGRLRHLVQLHLSRECNTPELAQHAVAELPSLDVAVYTADQNIPGPTLELGDRPLSVARLRVHVRRRRRVFVVSQPWLPGIEIEPLL